MISFLKVHYNNVIQKDLVLINNCSVCVEIVKPTKLLVYTRNLNLDDSSVLSSALALECISNQKSYFLRSVISSSRKVVGCKITLRKENLYKFLFNLNFRVLPKTKQFQGLRFPIESNIFSFSLKDMLSFEELTPFVKFFNDLNCLNCHIHICSKNNKDVKFLLRSLLLCVL